MAYTLSDNLKKKIASQKAEGVNPSAYSDYSPKSGYTVSDSIKKKIAAQKALGINLSAYSDNAVNSESVFDEEKYIDNLNSFSTDLAELGNAWASQNTLADYSARLNTLKTDYQKMQRYYSDNYSGLTGENLNKVRMRLSDVSGTLDNWDNAIKEISEYYNQWNSEKAYETDKKEYEKQKAEYEERVSPYTKYLNAEDFEVRAKRGKASYDGQNLLNARTAGGGMKITNGGFFDSQPRLVLDETNTAEEKLNLYYYLRDLSAHSQLGTREKQLAQEYFDILEAEAANKYADDRYQKKFGDWNGWAKAAAALPMSLAGVVDFAAAIGDLTEYGRVSGLTKAGYGLPGRTSSRMNADVIQDITEATKDTFLNTSDNFVGEKLGIDNVAAFLYSTGFSMAQSTAAITLLGHAGGILLAGNAASSTMYDSFNKGFTSEESLALGLIAGVAEMATETFSIEKLLTLNKPDTVKSLLSNVLKQSITEGSEEFFSDVINYTADAIIMQDKSEFALSVAENLAAGDDKTAAVVHALLDKVPDTVASTLGGMLSGAIMGGGKSLADYTRINSSYAKEGKAYRLGNVKQNGTAIPGNIQGLVSDLSEMEGKAGEYAKELSGKKRVSDREVGRALKYARNQMLESSIGEQLQNSGLPQEKIGSVASTITKYLTKGEDTLTRSEKKVINTTEAKTIIDQIQKYTPGDSDSAWYEDTLKAMSAISESAPTNAAYFDVPDEVRTATDTETTAATTLVETKTDAGDFFAGYAKQNKLSDIVGDINTAYENYVKNGGDMTPERFATVADLAYNYGRAGLRVADVAKVTDVEITDEINALYEKGKERYVADLKSRREASAQRPAAKIDTERTRKTSDISEKEARENHVNMVREDKLSDAQKTRRQFVSRLAENLSVNVRYFSSATRKEGWYDGRTHTVYLNIEASEYGHRTLEQIAAHEFVHVIASNANSADVYTELRDFITEYFYKGDEDAVLNGITEIAERYKQTNVPLDDTSEAMEEFVANACMDIFRDVDAVTEMASTHRGLFDRLVKWLDSFLDKLKSIFANQRYANQYSEQIAKDIDAVTKVREMVARGLDLASLREDGVVVDGQSDSAVMNSIDFAWKTQEEIDKQAKRLAMTLGVTEEDAIKWISSEMSTASLLLNDKYSDLIYDVDDTHEAIQKNSDYPQGTLDFSNICRKRIGYTRILDRIQKRFPNRVITAVEMAQIREILIENDVQVACGLCFVEDRRQRDGAIAKEFQIALSAWREGKSSYTPPNAKKAKDFNDSRTRAMNKATSNYTPTIYECVTLDGMKSLRENHPDIYAAWIAFNNSRGQQSARLVQGEAEYKRQILDYSPDTVQKINDLGGLRIYSFSDFQEMHLIDIIQAIQDCAAMGIKIQGYTKVPAFAKLLRGTGVKLNRSLIAKGDLGYHYDANGNVVLDYDTVEGIDINDEDFFDSTDDADIGNILVGINDVQIRAAMLDPFVDYIIPYHTGQSAKVREIKKLGAHHNYKNSQTDRVMGEKGRLVRAPEQINIYTDVLAAAEKEGKPITNKVEFVEKFLAVAKERGITPRFSQFLKKDRDGNFVYTEGYHKFLIDFKMFDQNGNILPQNEVVPNFDDEFITTLLDRYVEDQKTNEPIRLANEQKALDEIYDTILKADRLASVTPQERVRTDIREGQYEHAKPLTKKESALITPKISGKGVAKISAKQATAGIKLSIAPEIKKSTAQDFTRNALALQEMRPVKKMTGTEIDNPNLAAEEIMRQYFESLGNHMMTERFGDIALKNSTIRSEVRHGMHPNKLSALYAIEEVLENGQIVDVAQKNTGVYRTIVAAPVTVANAPYIVGVMLQSDEKSQRLYAHDIIIASEEELAQISRDILSQTRSPDTNEFFISSILQAAMIVKGKNENILDIARKIDMVEIEKRYEEARAKKDEEGMRKWVRKAAMKYGYNTPLLYHGTRFFGWTTYEDKNHKTPFIYTSTRSSVSAHYAGDNHYAFARPIGRKYRGGDSVNDIIADAETVYGTKYHKMTTAEKSARYDSVKAGAQRVADKINELASKVKDTVYTWDTDEGERIGNAIANVEEIFFVMVDGDIQSFKDYANDDYGFKEAFLHDMSKWEEAQRIVREYYDENRAKFSPEEKSLLGYLTGYDLGDVAIDINFSVQKLLANDELIVAENGNISVPSQLREAMDNAHNIGAYELYGNLGNNPYVFDANGGQFYALKNSDMGDGWYDTDSIAKWAFEHGYTSVIMKNIYDYGDIADNYVFFDSSQIKSADPITYDDNGNVIPLSERFNSENKDIRYSIAPISPREMLHNEIAGLSDEEIKKRGLLTYRRNIDKYNDLRQQREEILDSIGTLSIDGKGRATTILDRVADAGKRVAKLVGETVGYNGEDAVDKLNAVADAVSELDALRKQRDNIVNAVTDDKLRADVETQLGRIEGLTEQIRKQAQDLIARAKKINFKGETKEKRAELWKSFSELVKAERASNAELLRAVQESNKTISEFLTKQRNRVAILDQRIDRVESELDAAEKGALKKEMDRVVREAVDMERAIQNERLAEYRMDVGERKIRQYYLPRIQKITTEISNTILHPSAKKHYPEAINTPLKRVIEAIAPFAISANEAIMRRTQNENLVRAMTELEDALRAADAKAENAQTSDKSDIFDGLNKVDFPPELIQWVTEVRGMLSDYGAVTETFTNGNAVYDLDGATLKQIYKILRTVRQIANNASRVFSSARYETMDNLARASVEHMRVHPTNTKTIPLADPLKKLLLWDNAQPVTAFDRLGDAGRAIFNGLTIGQEKLATNTKAIEDFINDEIKLTEAEVKKWRKSETKITIGENEYTVPMTFLMSLHCLAKRPAARQHLLTGGGMRFADTTTGKLITETTRYAVTTFTEADLAAVEEVLAKDPRALEVADKLQEYMNTVGSDWFNEISMARYGYRAATERYYFPITTVKGDSVEAGKESRTSIYSLLNKSFTNELSGRANNAIVVGDILEVFGKHMGDMATYNAYALPMLDTIHWFNYKENLGGGKERNNVQEAMRLAFGNNAKEYFAQLLNDISGSVSGGLSEGWALGIIRKAHAVSVAANIRVAIQQPLSIVRAFDILPAKYIKDVSAILDYKSVKQDMIDHSGTAVWKVVLGMYNNNVATPLIQQITKSETTVDKILDKSMFLAELGDNVTWTVLWQACRDRIGDTRPSLKTDSEEYYDAVNELFRDVIYRTQVMDSVLTRSALMRSNKWYHRSLTAFMAEPTTTYNALLRRIDQLDYDTKKMGRKEALAKNAPHLLRTFALFAISGILGAAVTAASDTKRDDDKYETLVDKYVDHFIDNLIENLHMHNNIPYIRDVVSILKGYEVSRDDMALVTALVKAAQTIGNPNATTYAKVFKTLEAVSQLSGIPASSLTREVVGLWNTIFGTGNPSLKLQTSKDSNTAGYEAMYKAISSGNELRVAALLEDFESNDVKPETIYNGVKNAVKKQYVDGKISDSEVYEFMEDLAGVTGRTYDPNDVYFAIDKWNDTTPDSYSEYEHFDDAFAKGQNIKSEVQTLMDHGKTKSGIRSHISSVYKPIYKAASAEERVEIRKKLANTGLYTVDEIVKMCNEWQYK